MISVPITQETVLNTLEKLPRLPKDAGLIPIQLKKKKEYKGCHKKELINPENTIAALKYLKLSGHPYYQFIGDDDDLISYKLRCEDQDQQGHKLIFDSDKDTIDEALEQFGNNTMENEIDEKAETEEAPIDVIRKYQFDHNKNIAAFVTKYHGF